LIANESSTQRSLHRRWAVAAIALVLLVLVGGAPVLSRAQQPQAPAVSTIPAVEDLLDRVDADRALDDVRQLSGDAPLCLSTGCDTITNRLTGSDGLERAVDYIVESTAELGYAVTVQDWRRGVYFDRNVILRKPGVVSPTEEVYFVAHVDGVAACPNRRCPAADDNASGTVAGLELARSFGESSFERTIVLLFSTGEEQNMQGVSAYIDRLSPAELGAIKYLVNADMVGYDGDSDAAMELYYGDHEPSLALAESMRDVIRAYQLGLSPRLNSECG